MFQGSNPGGYSFFSSPGRPDRPWSQPSLLRKGYWATFKGAQQRGRGREVDQSALPRALVRNDVFPTYLHAFIARTGASFLPDFVPQTMLAGFYDFLQLFKANLRGGDLYLKLDHGLCWPSIPIHFSQIVFKFTAVERVRRCSWWWWMTK
jgi:hypothetical protein